MKNKQFGFDLQKLKERTSRPSLAVVFSIVVFVILVIAILLALLIVYILTELGLLSDINAEGNLFSIILLILAISVVIGFLITFFLGRIPLKPINELINKMNRLASGDFKARLKFGSALSAYPAFEEISTAFNKMAEELEKTEMLRSDFINNFSHEFKTPIVSISGFAKLLNKGNLTEEEKKEYYSLIEQESLRLSTMATNVLNLTKVENQTILTDVTEYNLSEQLRSVVLMFENQWVNKQTDLSIDLEEYNICANQQLLKQVWINLFDNAIKFSKQNGSIKIEIKDNLNHYAVIFSNSGNDIPKDKLDKIFNKFYQADESHATFGNGLGLSIVNRIVKLHNGSINVKSENEETTFTVLLPKKQ